MKKHILLGSLAFLALLQPLPLLAQSLDDLAQAQLAADAVWDKTPLDFTHAFFVSEPPAAYGMYTARPDTPFKPGEKLVVYAEPVAYGWKDKGDGTFDFGFDVDLAVKSADGAVLSEQKGFSHLALNSHAKNHEFMLTLTLDLTGADPGQYTLEYTIHDIASDKTAVIDLPFTMGS